MATPHRKASGKASPAMRFDLQQIPAPKGRSGHLFGQRTKYQSAGKLSSMTVAAPHELGERGLSFEGTDVASGARTCWARLPALVGRQRLACFVDATRFGNAVDCGTSLE